MVGTLILSLLFSAYFLWTLHATHLYPDEAKKIEYTHQGSVLGFTFYCTLPDEEGFMSVCGANIVTDTFVGTLVDLGVQMNNGELKVKLKEL